MKILINFDIIHVLTCLKFYRHYHCTLFLSSNLGCSGSQAQGNWLSVWGNVNQLKALPPKPRHELKQLKQGDVLWKSGTDVTGKPMVHAFMAIPPVFSWRLGYLPFLGKPVWFWCSFLLVDCNNDIPGHTLKVKSQHQSIITLVRNCW
jgi:hypothetical protein